MFKLLTMFAIFYEICKAAKQTDAVPTDIWILKGVCSTN